MGNVPYLTMNRLSPPAVGRRLFAAGAADIGRTGGRDLFFARAKTIVVAFIAKAIEPPSYGWENNGELVVPTRRQLLSELWRRLNVFADRKNWVPATNFAVTIALAPFAFVFFAKYCTWPLLTVFAVYSNFVVSSYGTVWFHRYGTHRAFAFKHRITRFLFAFAVPKLVVEEAYIVPHHVHHALADRPGDPYTPRGGKLYCFLADLNHGRIRQNMSEDEYRRLSKLMSHTGVRLNRYAQYQRWGSFAHPLRTVAAFVLSWGFWYGVFFAIGGHGLATACFAASFVWLVNVRMFNFGGHGEGEVRHKDGLDFHRGDLSVNQLGPGLIGGEWHNNHHMFPRSARAGFLRYQVDPPWQVIRFLRALGLVDCVIDDRERFLLAIRYCRS